MAKRRPARVTPRAEAGPSYRVLVGIQYPTSAAALARIRAGEQVPRADREVREVAPGEVVDDIPSESIGWLLEQGCIEEVTVG